ncbi:uncharacterized protein LOC122369894 [Amphibalanus amphitrite]|uniref:uncharacterized protein LOC122369894 n=1 Tax=Amphibalanus amphitrite TaxID=1232801 RepID=UPI001C905480|nr:uncharacterized protein LOC122369894 [Amphibalanus amphitrite]
MKTFYSQLAPIASPQCTICSAIETVPGSWTNLSASTTAPLLARLTAALGRQWAADLCSATLCLSCLRQLQGVEQLRGRHQRLEASLARVCRKASDSLDASATSCIACHSLLSVHDTANAFWDKAQFSSTLLANILAKFMTKPPEPGSSAGSRVCGRCVARLNQLDLLAVRADRRARAMGGRLRAGAAAAGARRPNGPPDSQAVPEDPAGHLTPLDEMLLQLTADHEEEAGLPSPSLPLLTTGGPSADRSSDLLNISGRPDTGGGLEKAGRGDGLRGEGLEEYGRNDGGLEAPVDDGVGELLGDVQAVEGGPQKANSDRQNNKDSRDFRPTSKVVQPVSSAAAAASQPPDRPVRTIYVQLVAGDATGAAGPAEVNEVRAAPATAPAPAPAPAVTATKGRRPAKIKVQETVQVVRLGPSDRLVPRPRPYHRKRPKPPAADNSTEDADDPSSADGPSNADGLSKSNDPSSAEDQQAVGESPAPQPPVKRGRGRPRKTQLDGTQRTFRELHRKLQYMTARAALPNQVSDPIGPPSGPDRPVGPGTAASGDTAVKSEREEGGEQWLEAQDRVAERDSQVVGTVSSATLGWLGPPAEPSHVTHRRRLAEAMERVNSRIAEKRLKSSRFAATKEDREDENVEPREDGEDIEEEFEDGEDTVKAEQSETSEEWTVSVRSRRVNGLYVCEVCHDSFAMLRELLKHERTHTEAKFPCPMCNRSFTLPKLVRRHQKFHKVPRAYQCGECGLRCRSQLVLLDHMHTHTGGEHISCGQCGQTFASRVRYRSHLRAHKGRPGPPHCAECRLKFANKAALQRHQREQHPEPQLIACPEPDCERRFDSQKRLTHHLLQHLAGPPWRCKLCDKEFRSKYSLRDHVRTHSGQKPFECEICAMRFSLRSNLAMHMRYVHQNDRRFKCTLCGKGYKRRQLLQYHMLSHEGVRPLSCPHCPMKMIYPQHLKLHLQTHSGEKPHRCDVCSKAFSRRDNLRAHMFTHSNKKPFECRQCGMGFVRKMALLQHMEHFSHGEHPDDYVINRTLVTSESAPAGEQAHTIELLDTADGPLVLLVDSDGNQEVLVADGQAGDASTAAALRCLTSAGRRLDLIIDESGAATVRGGEEDGEQLVLADGAAADTVDLILQEADGRLVLSGDGADGQLVLSGEGADGQLVLSGEGADGQLVLSGQGADGQLLLQGADGDQPLLLQEGVEDGAAPHWELPAPQGDPLELRADDVRG